MKSPGSIYAKCKCKGYLLSCYQQNENIYTCSQKKRDYSLLPSMLESKCFLNSSIHKGCSISIWLCYYTYMLVSYSFLTLSKMLSHFFFLAINLNTFGYPNISTLKSLHFHYVIILLSFSPTVVYPFFFMCSSYIFNHLFQRFI